MSAPPPPPHSHGVRTNWGTRGEGSAKPCVNEPPARHQPGHRKAAPTPVFALPPPLGWPSPGGSCPGFTQTLQLLPGTSAYTPEQPSSCVGPGLPGPGSFPPLASLEEDFITWREQFWPAVCEHFGVEATGEESR